MKKAISPHSVQAQRVSVSSAPAVWVALKSPFRVLPRRPCAPAPCANIDYGFFEAKTTFGRIGVRVWIYKGDLTDKELAAQQAANNRRGNRRDGDRRRQGNPWSSSRAPQREQLRQGRGQDCRER